MSEGAFHEQLPPSSYKPAPVVHSDRTIDYWERERLLRDMGERLRQIERERFGCAHYYLSNEH
jgi:hypothetical protein